MKRWSPFIVGAVLAVVLVGVPAMLLPRGDASPGEAGAEAQGVSAGIFDFPQPVERSASAAGPRRLEAIRSMSTDTLDATERKPQVQRRSIAGEVAAATPIAALMMIEAHRREAVDRTEELELERLAAEVFDRLWWQRIGELIGQRESANQRLTALRAEYSRASDPGRRGGIADEVQQLSRRVEEATAELRDMGYSAATAPDLSSAMQMEMLRAQRDGPTYMAWQRSVMRSLGRSGGLDPWLKG